MEIGNIQVMEAFKENCFYFVGYCVKFIERNGALHLECQRRSKEDSIEAGVPANENQRFRLQATPGARQRSSGDEGKGCCLRC